MSHVQKQPIRSAHSKQAATSRVNSLFVLSLFLTGECVCVSALVCVCVFILFACVVYVVYVYVCVYVVCVRVRNPSRTLTGLNLNQTSFSGLQGTSQRLRTQDEAGHGRRASGSPARRS